MTNRIIDYLLRIGKSRGFGIQSPWAYSIVTDVIYERWPYYAYANIDRQYADPWERKREKLLFRLAQINSRHIVHIIDLTIIDAAVAIDQMQMMHADDIVVIENAYASEANHRSWLTIRNSSACGITFDLRRLCICFMPSDRYKQHYKLNF